MHERQKGALLHQKSVLLPTTKLLNFILQFILIGFNFISIQILTNIYSSVIVLLPVVHTFHVDCPFEIFSKIHGTEKMNFCL